MCREKWPEGVTGYNHLNWRCVSDILSPVAMGDDDLTHHKDKNSAELKFKTE